MLVVLFHVVIHSIARTPSQSCRRLADSETGEIGRTADGRTRLYEALVLRHHNHLRIRRVLASLAVTGPPSKEFIDLWTVWTVLQPPRGSVDHDRAHRGGRFFAVAMFSVSHIVCQVRALHEPAGKAPAMGGPGYSRSLDTWQNV